MSISIEESGRTRHSSQQTNTPNESPPFLQQSSFYKKYKKWKYWIEKSEKSPQKDETQKATVGYDQGAREAGAIRMSQRASLGRSIFAEHLCGASPRASPEHFWELWVWAWTARLISTRSRQLKIDQIKSKMNWEGIFEGARRWRALFSTKFFFDIGPTTEWWGGRGERNDGPWCASMKGRAPIGSFRPIGIEATIPRQPHLHGFLPCH